MVRIGVLLNGCGAKDGSEIHESVLTLLALSEHAVETVCYAYDAPQARVWDHYLNREVAGEKRNMLHEAARIARGTIFDASTIVPQSIDACILPGGNGTAYNLCTFARDGAQMTVDPRVATLVRALHEAQKPLAAICIAPMILAKVLGSFHIALTLGVDPTCRDAVTAMGAQHVACQADDCVVDPKHRIVTTPAYMTGQTIGDIWPGIRKLVATTVQLAQHR